VAGIRREFLVSLNLGDNARGMRRCTVVQKAVGLAFFNLRPNAMDSKAQSLCHIFIKSALLALIHGEPYL
jgi:hypothetical protein